MDQLRAAVSRLGQENASLAAELAQNWQQAPEDDDGNAAVEELQGQVQRLRLERRLMRVVTKVALAIASDTLSGRALRIRLSNCT